MFTHHSKAGTGITILLITLAFQFAGIDIPEESITEAVLAAGEVIGFILVVVGTFDRKDLRWGLFRR